MKKEYFVGRPSLVNRDKFMSRVSTILDSQIYTNNGPMVQELEKKVSERLGVKHCIAMANATLALELLLGMLSPGEVILPSFTFIATAHAVIRAGHTPIFVDIDQDCLIDVSKIEECLTSNTIALLPVNLFGSMCDIKELDNLAQAYGLHLFYDSTQALGTIAGAFGDAEVFSLHATKLCNSFEGGLITTNNDNISTKMKQYRNFGYVGLIPDSEGEIIDIGTNAKMSEVHAAAGLTNFEGLSDLTRHNFMNWKAYDTYMPEEVSLYHPQYPETSNYSYIVCRHPYRDKIVKYLHSQGIYARKYFKHLCHRVYGQENLDLPVSSIMAEEIFCLPTGLSVTHEDIEYICSRIQEGIECPCV